MVFTGIWNEYGVTRQLTLEQLHDVCLQNSIEFSEDASSSELRELLHKNNVVPLASMFEDFDDSKDPSSPTAAALRIRNWKVNARSPSFLVCKIDDLDLQDSTIEFYQHINGGLGSSGVFVAQTKDGVLVVKEAPSPVSTLFANSLGSGMCNQLFLLDEALETFPVRWGVPSTRLLARENPNFAHIIDGLSKLENVRNSGQGCDIPRIQRLSLCRYILLIEFVPGKTLYNMHPDRTKLILDERVLSTIGSTLLFDMLINNFDRVPSIWNNEGNAANLIFQTSEDNDGGECCSGISLIDQTVTSISHEEQRQKYMEKVYAFVSGAVKGELAVAEPLQGFFLTNTYNTCDIGEKGMKALLNGFCKSIDLIRKGKALRELINAAAVHVTTVFSNAEIDEEQTKLAREQLQEVDAFVNEVYQTVVAAADGIPLIQN